MSRLVVSWSRRRLRSVRFSPSRQCTQSAEWGQILLRVDSRRRLNECDTGRTAVCNLPPPVNDSLQSPYASQYCVWRATVACSE